MSLRTGGPVRRRPAWGSGSCQMQLRFAADLGRHRVPSAPDGTSMLFGMTAFDPDEALRANDGAGNTTEPLPTSAPSSIVQPRDARCGRLRTRSLRSSGSTRCSARRCCPDRRAVTDDDLASSLAAPRPGQIDTSAPMRTDLDDDGSGWTKADGWISDVVAECVQRHVRDLDQESETAIAAPEERAAVHLRASLRFVDGPTTIMVA